ncbi:hypothetical protein [Gordonia humi]|uniref:Uncharacterized membrane protein YhaH (DUF805 family) n=1 Tax=Gordonia humi TaxID=686429 RepID=A0A840ESR0_9ACTN|nr:hypothetical protein [Gordonia humi]MBB4134722.1 uncharacterized membrane protein YhaH (DUF805 family) [Gordonia humi]
MTFPDDDPDRIPTQAELDAEDMAEIARRSADAEHRDRYPARPVDPGPPPTVLTRGARIAWLASAVAGLIWVVYGFVNLSATTTRLADRLEPGLEELSDVDSAAKAQSLAEFWPLAFLIGIPVVVALSWPMLVGVARTHSRNLRNVYLSTVVVICLFVPVCADLLFNYPDAPRWVWAMAWVQFGLLIVSAILTLSRAVGQWLPPSMRVKPFRVMRGQ